MTIQWFPGHMTKARREIEKQLKVVDLIVELVDARAPVSSQNPMLQEIIAYKPKLMVLMKDDLADPNETEKWIRWFENNDIKSVSVDVNSRTDIQNVIKKAKQIGQERMKKLQAKGVNPRAIRGMIIGIPNVGKSSLINRLVGKKTAKIGDRPGITKHQQWIKVSHDFELLDTPGVLWPKFEDQNVGIRLAAIGTIKDSLLSLQDITAYVITYMKTHYPIQLENRYNITENMDDMWDVFIHIGKQRGALESGGHVNFDKVADIVLRDLRTGKLGPVTLEKSNEVCF